MVPSRPLREAQRRTHAAWARATRRRRARGGLAALEFALILPVMLSMVAGVYDLSQAYVAWERLTTCAQAINQIATTLAANSATTNSLTQSQASTAASAIYAYLPGTLTGASSSFGVAITSVAMTVSPSGCTTGCSYNAHVAWSGTFAGSAAVQRPCDLAPGVSALIAVADNSQPSPDTLPTDVYSAASLLVVDVTYTFTPVFTKFAFKTFSIGTFSGSFTISQSSYYPPRAGLSNPWITYFPGTSDSTTLCTGYPAA